MYVIHVFPYLLCVTCVLCVCMYVCMYVHVCIMAYILLAFPTAGTYSTCTHICVLLLHADSVCKRMAKTVPLVEPGLTVARVHSTAPIL